MADYSWGTPGSLTAYLSTTLNSLANNTTDLGSTIIDNQTNKDLYIDLELVLASLDLSAQTNPVIEVYIIESIDGGTNYDQGDDATSDTDLYPSADKLLCTIGVRTANGAEAKYAIKTGLIITPSKFKLLVINKTGATLASSGNTLKYRTYGTASA